MCLARGTRACPIKAIPAFHEGTSPLIQATREQPNYPSTVCIMELEIKCCFTNMSTVLRDRLFLIKLTRKHFFSPWTMARLGKFQLRFFWRRKQDRETPSKAFMPRIQMHRHRRHAESRWAAGAGRSSIATSVKYELILAYGQRVPYGGRQLGAQRRVGGPAMFRPAFHLGKPLASFLPKPRPFMMIG
jgi:hypothetical protein